MHLMQLLNVVQTIPYVAQNKAKCCSSRSHDKHLKLSMALQVTELKDLCKQERVKGYSKLKKDQLRILLQEQMQSR